LANQRGQVLTVAEAVLVAADTLAVAVVSAALLEAVLVLRQPFTAAVCEQHRLFRVHTSLAEVSADQVRRLDCIIAAQECLL
jgi:hypothetical protein